MEPLNPIAKPKWGQEALANYKKYFNMHNDGKNCSSNRNDDKYLNHYFEASVNKNGDRSVIY